MSADLPARCLDLTRLISRQGRSAYTGIDRVELAYLRQLVGEPVPLFLLVGTSLGYILLDQAGAEAVLSRVEGQVPWGDLDLLGRLRMKSPRPLRRAQADLRRLGIARCRKGRLRRMLATHVPPGSSYLNVGHSNLSEETLKGWRDTVKGQVSVLVHDMIPLDHPQFENPAVAGRFRETMKLTSAHADLAIYNSAATQADAERWFGSWGRIPNGIVAHLGVGLPKPDPLKLPSDLDLERPYFVTLSTIEPRKNHTLLLDIWEDLARDAGGGVIPSLIIVGSRGWSNESFFQRFDRSPLKERNVFERAGLDDGAVSALMAGAAGALFPSLAEGFGLPPLEAAALGVPVVCNTLPVYQELLGDIAVYADSGDVYLWRQIITELTEKRQAGQTRNGAEIPRPDIPTWADHFNLVLKVT